MSPTNETKGKPEIATIYLHVDHLDKGRYELHLLQDNTVIKKFIFKK